jgi:hypothetical protein
VLENRPIAADRAARWRQANVKQLHRARLTNNPLMVRANRHTSQGRRIADLFEAYLKALGQPTDPVLIANILAAAELKASAEILRAKLLAGAAVDLDQVIKVEGLASRSERKLGLDQRQRGQQPAESYASLSARIQAEEGARRAQELAEDAARVRAAAEAKIAHEPPVCHGEALDEESDA